MRDPASTVYAPPRAKSPWTIAELYAPAAARLYAFGRCALVEALRLADAKGKNALLPSFICRDLLASLSAVGARPLFYDVGPDLAPVLSPKEWPAAAVVLAVDFFGFPQDLSPFFDYCRRRNALLIEDAAHALFSRDETGRLLGTRAQLGILSPRKSLPLPNGGALLVNDPALAGRLPSPLPSEPRAGARAALKAACRPLFGLLGARAAHAGLCAFRALRGDGSGRAAPDPDSERRLPGLESPCEALSRPILCADPGLEVSRRRALWSLCDEIARRAGLEPVFPLLPQGIVPYAYAFRTSDLAGAAALFAAKSLSVLPWPDLPGAVLPLAPAHYKNVGLVHFLW